MSKRVDRWLLDALNDFALGRPMRRAVLVALRDRELLAEMRVEGGFEWQMTESGKLALADAAT